MTRAAPPTVRALFYRVTTFHVRIQASNAAVVKTRASVTA
jgi:hypothetical protein